MNNFAFPYLPINNLQSILEELIKINETLKRIEYKINIDNKNNIEKEDNYYMI